MTTAEEKLVIEGGKVKLLTQQRQIAAKDQGGVICDYLRFTILKDRLLATVNMEPDTEDQLLVQVMAEYFAELLGYSFGMMRPGRDYYDFSATIENEFGQEVASVSGGGQSQRDTFCFTLKGEGCTYAHPGWERRVHEFFGSAFPKLTRIDLAKDFYDHAHLSVDAAVIAYEVDGGFSYRNRMPTHQEHGVWIGPVKHSRTFQVGKRESGKLCRVYEKDHQFGNLEGQWVRCEVELRAVNRIVPWDALVAPGAYFAGAYEFCNWLVHLDAPIRISTQTKVAEVSVEKVMRWVNRVVAPTLVQLTSALPNFDWLEHMVIDNAQRRIPRGLRGLNRHAITQGLDKYLLRYAPHLEAAPLVGL